MKHVELKQLAVHENISFVDLNAEDIHSMKISLRNPGKIDLDNWRTYLNAVSKLSKSIGEDTTVDVSFLLQRLKNYRDNAIQPD